VDFKWDSVVELIATASNAVVDEHYTRTAKYMAILKAREAWVVHFTVAEQAEDYQYRWPTDYPYINAVYFRHSADFKKCVAYYRLNGVVTKKYFLNIFIYMIIK